MVVLAASGLTLAGAPAALAQSTSPPPLSCDTTWTGGGTNNDFLNPSNWNSGAPSSTTAACLPPGSYTTTLNGAAAAVKSLSIGAPGAATEPILVISGSSTPCGCGYGSTADLTANGDVENFGTLQLETRDAGSAELSMASGTLYNLGTLNAVRDWGSGVDLITGATDSSGLISVAGGSTSVSLVIGTGTDSSTLTNKGQLTVGGTLEIKAGATLTQAAGRVLATNAGLVQVDSAASFDLTGGSIDTNPVVLDGGANLTIPPGTVASGTVQVGNSGFSGSGNPVNFAGDIPAGVTVHVLAHAFPCGGCNGRAAALSAASDVTNDGTVTLDSQATSGSSGDASLTVTGKFVNNGTLATQGTGAIDRIAAAVTNNGTTTVGSPTAIIGATSSRLANSGTVTVSTGGSLEVQSGATLGQDAGTLTATGPVNVDTGGTFSLLGGTITASTANTPTRPVVLDGGTTLAIPVGTSANGAIQLGTGASSGSGAAVDVADGFVPAGITITLVGYSFPCGCGGRPTVLTGPGLVNNGTIVLDTAPNGGDAHLSIAPGSITNNGTLSGTGTLTGTQSVATTDLVNHGLVSPGSNGHGALTVNGGFTQGSDGTLISTTTANGATSVLSVIGTTTLQGALSINPAAGYTPAVGDAYRVLTASALPAGTFATVEPAEKGSSLAYTAGYDASGVTVTAVKPKVDTTTTVKASSNPAVEGAPVTLTATVTPTATSPSTPTGAMTFSDGGKALACTGAHDGVLGATGTATCTVAGLGAGAHSIVATYGGDGGFNGSASSPLSEKVLARTSTVLSSSLNPSTSGAAVTFSATVTPATGSGTPTGSVKFVADSSPTALTCTGASDGVVSARGVATCTTSALTIGTHSVMAEYGGDAGFAASSSAPSTQTVQAPGGGGGVISSPTPSPTTTPTTSPSPTTSPTPTPTSTSTPTPTATATAAPLPPGVSSSEYTDPTSTPYDRVNGTRLSVLEGSLKATVQVLPNALPAGTTLSLYKSFPTAVKNQLSAGTTYVTGFAVSWRAPDGTTPKATAPVTLTITDPLINAGDQVYVETGVGLILAQPPTKVMVTNGEIRIMFNTDPGFVVARPTSARLLDVAVSRHQLRIGRAAPRLFTGRAPKGGTVIQFRSSRAATVRLRFQRLNHGYVVSTRRLVIHVRRGTSRLYFDGELPQSQRRHQLRALPPGRYRILLSAAVDGVTSAVRRVELQLLG